MDLKQAKMCISKLLLHPQATEPPFINMPEISDYCLNFLTTFFFLRLYAILTAATKAIFYFADPLLLSGLLVSQLKAGIKACSRQRAHSNVTRTIFAKRLAIVEGCPSLGASILMVEKTPILNYFSVDWCFA